MKRAMTLLAAVLLLALGLALPAQASTHSPATARRCDLIIKWRVNLTGIPNWGQSRWNGPDTCRNEYQRGVSKCHGNRTGITLNVRGGWIKWTNHTTESRATCPGQEPAIIRFAYDIRICDPHCTPYVRTWIWHV